MSVGVDLFGREDDCRTAAEFAADEWTGMPEFVQERSREFAKLTVRFETEAALAAFADLVGQSITPLTKSIWYPRLDRYRNKGVHYRDE